MQGKRLTPLERAIAAKLDRRAKYDQKKRDAGLVKVSLWVRADCADALKAAAKVANAWDGQGVPVFTVAKGKRG
jgi:hypothetical protein